MREEINMQTPCTREFTTKRVLMYAGWLSWSDTTVGSPLFTSKHPAPCPSSAAAQILVWTSYLNLTTGCLDSGKGRGWNLSCQKAATGPLSCPRCPPPGPISSPTHPKLLLPTFIFCQSLLSHFQLYFHHHYPTPFSYHVLLRTHSPSRISRNAEYSWWLEHKGAVLPPAAALEKRVSSISQWNTDVFLSSLSTLLPKIVSAMRVKEASLHRPGFLATCFFRKTGCNFKTQRPQRWVVTPPPNLEKGTNR